MLDLGYWRGHNVKLNLQRREVVDVFPPNICVASSGFLGEKHSSLTTGLGSNYMESKDSVLSSQPSHLLQAKRPGRLVR